MITTQCNVGKKTTDCGNTGFCIMPMIGQAGKSSSYAPVVITEDFETIFKPMEGQKSAILKRHEALLNERYDIKQ